MLAPGDSQRLEAVVRSLSVASKSLRLYPASSPMPQQSTASAVSALEAFFAEGEPVLCLRVTRDGLAFRGEAICQNMVGADELVDALSDHGIAEVNITPGASIDELIAFLTTIGQPAEEVRESGGIATALVAAGVDSVRVTDVQLTVAEYVGPESDQDIDEFLRELAEDPDKLATWFAAASAGDPAGFEEGLMEIVRVAGPSGFEGLLEHLGSAFMQQNPDSKDAMLGLALDGGPARDLTGGMFRFLSSGDIAGSVLAGTFGKNMLSLSTALTRLPLEQVTAQVRADVQAMLPGSGHTSREAEFLNHMIEVRERKEPEAPLVDADRTYRSVMEAAHLSDEMIEQARGAVTGSGKALSAASVRTMLSLLDQQRDVELYCQSAESLAGMVPKLIEQGDIELASRVLSELSQREAQRTGSSPELAERMRGAMVTAVGPRSMGALLDAVLANPSLADKAREIVRYGGEPAAHALAAEAIGRKGDGLRVGEELVGRRFGDLVGQLAPQIQWYQVAPVAALLARDNDPRATQALQALMRRPDEQSRREVASGLSTVQTPVAERMLAEALRDPSAEVAMIAARAIAKSSSPTAGAMLAARLAEIDVDNADFLLARELIAGLSRAPGDAADEALNKLASRRALIKRGHFAEVQDLARQAQDHRRQNAGGGR